MFETVIEILLNAKVKRYIGQITAAFNIMFK